MSSEPRDGEVVFATVTLTAFTSGRLHVSYLHTTDDGKDWEAHRSILIAMRREIKRNLRRGPRGCPFSPFRHRRWF